MASKLDRELQHLRKTFLKNRSSVYSSRQSVFMGPIRAAEKEVPRLPLPRTHSFPVELSFLALLFGLKIPVNAENLYKN